MRGRPAPRGGRRPSSSQLERSLSVNVWLGVAAGGCIHKRSAAVLSGAVQILLSAFLLLQPQRLPLAEYFCCCLATVMIDCGGKSAAQLNITGSGWQPGRGWTLSGWHSRAGCGIMRPLGGAGHDGATLALMPADLDICPR